MLKMITTPKNQIVDPDGVAHQTRRPAEQQVTEAAMAQLYKELEVTRSEMRDLCSSKHRNRPDIAAKIVALVEQEDRLKREINTTKAALKPMRQKRAAAIEDKLRAERAECARTIVANLDAAALALSQIFRIQSAIEMAGGARNDTPELFAAHVRLFANRYTES